MPNDDEDLAEILARVDQLAAQRDPQKTRAGAIDRLGQWVNVLYSRIDGYRAAGLSWQDIAHMFIEADLPLKHGQWRADTLRAAFARERRRQKPQEANPVMVPRGQWLH